MLGSWLVLDLAVTATSTNGPQATAYAASTAQPRWLALHFCSLTINPQAQSFQLYRPERASEKMHTALTSLDTTKHWEKSKFGPNHRDT